MSFHPIDMESWTRRAYYDHYFTDVPCTYSLCVQMDIARLLRAVQKSGVKLYPVLIYGISRAVNAHAEFRMSVGEDGVPGTHDVVHPGYTVFHPQDETFSTLWSQYDASFPVFYRRYLEDVAAYGGAPVPSPKPACPEGTFDISCIPWSHFTSFNLNLKNGYRYLPPIFTMGKYEQSGGKVLLPLALQVHHAVCDGFHAARLLREVEEWAQAFVPQGV